MPGLLDTKGFQFYSLKFAIAVTAEMIGVLVFAFYSSSAPSEYAAWANGLSLAVMVYITANISGGHLNPAVTVATVCTGHISLLKAAAYIVAQIVGAVLAHLIQCGLVPSATVGTPVGARGIFFPKPGVTKGMAFGFEVIITFVLVSCVYAVAIGKPHFGNVGPLAIGLALWASDFAAGPYTGGAANPARVLGPAIVFNSKWGDAWVYVLAQLAGGLLSAAFSFPLYGIGADWARLWDRSSFRPHIHRRHHSRGAGSKSPATPKEPTLEEALGIADPFGPEAAHTADSTPTVTPDSKILPKKINPAGAGNLMAHGGGNAGNAPSGRQTDRHAAAPTMAQDDAGARRASALSTTMSDAPGFSGTRSVGGNENWKARQGLFGP